MHQARPTQNPSRYLTCIKTDSLIYWQENKKGHTTPQLLHCNENRMTPKPLTEAFLFKIANHDISARVIAGTQLSRRQSPQGTPARECVHAPGAFPFIPAPAWMHLILLPPSAPFIRINSHDGDILGSVILLPINCLKEKLTKCRLQPQPSAIRGAQRAPPAFHTRSLLGVTHWPISQASLVTRATESAAARLLRRS